MKVSVYDMCPKADNNLHKGRAHKIKHTCLALNKLKMHDTVQKEECLENKLNCVYCDTTNHEVIKQQKRYCKSYKCSWPVPCFGCLKTPLTSVKQW